MASVSPRNRGWIAQARGGFRRGAPLKAAACRMACRMVTPDRHAGSDLGCCVEGRRGSALWVGAPFSQQMRSGPPFVREARRDLEMKSIVPRASPLSCRVRAGIV